MCPWPRGRNTRLIYDSGCHKRGLSDVVTGVTPHGKSLTVLWGYSNGRLYPAVYAVGFLPSYMRGHFTNLWSARRCNYKSHTKSSVSVMVHKTRRLSGVDRAALVTEILDSLLPRWPRATLRPSRPGTLYRVVKTV